MFATLYDVHGNLAALEAVLAEIPAEATIVVGGDVVAGGPQPAETLERLRALGDRVRWLRGNADRELTPGEPGLAPPGALDADRAALSDEQIAFLHGLPPTCGSATRSTATPRRGTTSTSSPSARPRSGSRPSSPASTRRRRLRAHARAVRADDRRHAGGQLRQRRLAVRGRAGRVLAARPRAPAHAVPGRGAPQQSREEAVAGSTDVDSDLVPVGRVGRPHGLDGSFFVEPRASARGRSRRGELYAGGEPAEVVASKRGAGGRPVIRLDRRVERGTSSRCRGSAAAARRGGTSSTSSSSSGSWSRTRGGGCWARSRRAGYPANDVLELDSGASCRS